MNYSIDFQYLAEGESRPTNHSRDEEIHIEDGAFVPIPNVGDSVSCMFGGESKVFKVKSRHFSYFSGHCAVNIVLEDISDKEINERLNS